MQRRMKWNGNKVASDVSGDQLQDFALTGKETEKEKIFSYNFGPNKRQMPSLALSPNYCPTTSQTLTPNGDPHL